MGAGWQSLVAYINLGCYYIVGLPLGILLGFTFGFGAEVTYYLSFSLALLVLWVLVILQFCVAGYLVRDDWRHWFANLNLDSDHFNNQLEKRGQYCYLGQSCLIQLCILTSTEFAG